MSANTFKPIFQQWADTGIALRLFVKLLVFILWNALRLTFVTVWATVSRIQAALIAKVKARRCRLKAGHQTRSTTGEEGSHD